MPYDMRRSENVKANAEQQIFQVFMHHDPRPWTIPFSGKGMREWRKWALSDWPISEYPLLHPFVGIGGKGRLGGEAQELISFGQPQPSAWVDHSLNHLGEPDATNSDLVWVHYQNALDAPWLDRVGRRYSS
jgi:hypothetical protein